MKDFTIFVLDDDEMFCSLLMSLAKRKDFVFAIDGYKLDLIVFDDMKNLDRAVAYIKSNKPNLILLDYFLGPWGCTASIDILKKIVLCCVKETEVVVITGMYAEDIRFKLIEEATVQMNMSVIQKPFNIAELLEIIDVSIKRRNNV